MPDKRKFEEFVEKLIAEADNTGVNWCYSDGISMTEDARAFLKHYKRVVTAWETVLAMYEDAAVIVERKRRVK